MHEKGVLHHIMGKVIGFFPDMAVLLVNLGGHGESGELFMHGLGDEDARRFFGKGKVKDGGGFQEGNDIFVAAPGVV